MPDFRSSQGLWKTNDLRQWVSVDALVDHYNDFHTFYKNRVKGLADCTPHVGHQVLAEWEQKGLIDAIVTRNVEQFHQMAGSMNVYDKHF